MVRERDGLITEESTLKDISGALDLSAEGLAYINNKSSGSIKEIDQVEADNGTMADRDFLLLHTPSF